MDFDGLLEACFTWGGGTWSHFQLLARQVSLDPWFPYEAVQLFLVVRALGRRMGYGRQSTHCDGSVSPPAVVMTGHTKMRFWQDTDPPA